MATGGTAVLTDPSRSLLDNDDSVMSSPLSEVEDKDAENDEMDMEFTSSHLTHAAAPHRQNGDGSAHSLSDDDSGSNLSDIDVNDSEAETERLYDTPRKTNNIRDNAVLTTEAEQKHSTNGSDRIFERSPSKLQQQIQADVDAEIGDDDDDDELSDEPQEDHEHDEDDDNASIAYSEAESDKEDLKIHKKASQSPRPVSQESQIVARSTIVEDRKVESGRDTRKRKRSPMTGQSDQPLRKRTGSIIEPGDVSLTHDKTIGDKEGETTSVENRGGEHSSEEDAHGATTKDSPEDTADSIEGSTSAISRSKKSKRSNTKKRKGPDDEIVESAHHEAEGTAAVEGQAVEDDHIEAGLDEEAEAAHRNEEEMEKKRAAFEQLQAIEKHFAAFRDRLYDERLAQLNEEEAMLTAENPTHPEYLAMMQCIDSRRDDRLKTVEVEYKFNMESLERWSVARRAQILSQFFQSVRESREKALEELGRQWYEIQHERRRHANTTPDYGFRFPKTTTEQKKQAIAHSKETSILAGVAQHKGFPAAPAMKGAMLTEIDEDRDAITRAKQATLHNATAQHQPQYQEYGGLSFRRSLGPAGEQFLEHTPWANPNHPSHKSQQGSQAASHGPPTNRRHSHQPGSTFTHGHSAKHANSRLNGDLVVHKNSPTAATDLGRQSKGAAGAKQKATYV